MDWQLSAPATPSHAHFIPLIIVIIIIIISIIIIIIIITVITIMETLITNEQDAGYPGEPLPDNGGSFPGKRHLYNHYQCGR